MEVREIARLFRRWWWIVVLITTLGAAVAYFLTPAPVPVYEATTTVSLSQGSESLPDVQSVTTGQRLASTYGALLSTRPILEIVISDLALDMTPDDLGEMITVSNVSDTPLLTISVRDTNPHKARDIANEIVTVFIEQNNALQSSRYSTYRQQLEENIEELQAEIETRQKDLNQTQFEVARVQADLDEAAAQSSPDVETLSTRLTDLRIEEDRLELSLSQTQVRFETMLISYEDLRLREAESTDVMTVVEEAVVGKPIVVPPKQLINSLQGALAGIMLGVALVYVIEVLRASVIRTTEEIQAQLEIPSLGVISEIRGTTPPEKLVTRHLPRSPIAEAFRVIRTNLEFAAGENRLNTLVVSSSSPVEGKTTTAANLAVAIAQSGKRVILVDADLRRPSVHKMFEQTNTRGVTTALVDFSPDSLHDHLLASGIDNLVLMPSGPIPPNPADLLGSQRMVDLVSLLTDNADIVIFDSPPLLAVADAALLARICDATLLVALSGSTRMEALKRARDQILQSGANLVGVVLNRVTGADNGYGYYYYQYY